MKINYFTNLWSHHHEGVCRALHELLGDDFRLFLLQPLEHPASLARKRLGWNIEPPFEDWIVRPAATATDRDRVVTQLLNADVLVGSYSPFCPSAVLQEWVIRRRNLTFIMGERPFKDKITIKRLLTTRLLKRMYDLRCQLNHQNVHYLTMNHYCGEDLRLLRVCRDRIWTWGYFPPVSEKPPLPRPSSGPLELVWAGRMLECKKVSTILKASAAMLRSGRENFQLRLIGDGECQSALMREAIELGLGSRVTFLPFMPAAEVRQQLRAAHGYCFASDRHEGWGVALLEAMAEGCAVIANAAAGATLDLVVDKYNGWVYQDGDLAGQTAALCQLYDARDRGFELGLRAWRTMQAWSPSNAAARLLRLIEAIKNGSNGRLFESGVCSPK